MLGSRQVATSLDVEVSLLGSPGLGHGLGRHSFVSPSAEKLRGRVVDLFQLGGQVGSAPNSSTNVSQDEEF